MDKLAFIGAGQLALMTLPHAHRLGLRTVSVDIESAPGHALSHENIYGDLNQIETFEKLLKIQNLTHATLDIEHVSLEGIRLLESRGIVVSPSSKVLEMIQDKGKQREFLNKLGLPGPQYFLSDTRDFFDLLDFNKQYIVKMRTGGYDGKGVFSLEKGTLPESFNKFLLIEEKVAIKKELALLISRNKNGEIKCYDPVEMIFDSELNLMSSLYAPARIRSNHGEQMKMMAETIIKELNYTGVLAIEFFLDTNDQLFINELAPRPHNSGHHTQVAHCVDQFEQHLRAVMNLPLGETKTIKRALTYNIVGESEGEGFVTSLPQLLKMDDLFFQWYGKTQARKGRKMAHISLVRSLDMEPESALEEMQQQYERIKSWLKIKTHS